MYLEISIYEAILGLTLVFVSGIVFTFALSGIILNK